MKLLGSRTESVELMPIAEIKIVTLSGPFLSFQCDFLTKSEWSELNARGSSDQLKPISNKFACLLIFLKQS